MSKEKIKVNRDIKVPNVRLIGATGEQLGIVSTLEAIKIAKDNGMDLLEVAPNAEPPVCRIMDFGKYKYEKKKKSKEAKKHQNVVQIKEIQLSPTTEEHDINYKINHIKRFLADGNKAKVTIRFKGREVNHAGIGKALLTRVIDKVADIATVEQEARLEGKRMSIILIAKP
ncbi:MAG: translation initiation factor IF-3 [Pseudomonadota bacterium]